MGKTTLYHPISLNVLRGSAEQGGWRLGKFKQIFALTDAAEAMYRVDILKYPKDLEDLSLAKMKEFLESCFAGDVAVLGIWVTKSGFYYAEIRTYATKDQVL